MRFFVKRRKCVYVYSVFCGVCANEMFTLKKKMTNYPRAETELNGKSKQLKKRTNPKKQPNTVVETKKMKTKQDNYIVAIVFTSEFAREKRKKLMILHLDSHRLLE